MKLETRKIPESEPEMVEIRYHWITDEIQEIISFVKSRQGQLSATRDGKRFEVPVVDLFYAESVDERLFLYTAREPHEDHCRSSSPERPILSRPEKRRGNHYFPEIRTGPETGPERR